MNQPENINSLMNVLNSPLAEDSRLCEAARYLRVSGDKRAIPPLYKRLADKNDAPWTRVEIVNAISGLVSSNQLQIPQINQLLVSLITSKSEPDEVKEAAIIALGNLGDKQAIEPLLGLIGRCSQNEQYGMILTSLQTLNQLKDPRSVPVLMRLLSCPDERISKLSAEILGEFGQDAFPALPRLADLEESYRGSERQAAHEAVLKIKKSISSSIR